MAGSYYGTELELGNQTAVSGRFEEDPRLNRDCASIWTEAQQVSLVKPGKRRRKSSVVVTCHARDAGARRRFRISFPLFCCCLVWRATEHRKYPVNILSGLFFMAVALG